MWPKIKMLLALRCDVSTRLISQALDHDLPPVERWAIRLHALSCRSCHRFRRQVLFLRTAIQQRFNLESATGVDSIRLADEARARIAAVIANKSS